jgi:hypothetical protein
VRRLDARGRWVDYPKLEGAVVVGAHQVVDALSTREARESRREGPVWIVWRLACGGIRWIAQAQECAARRHDEDLASPRVIGA